VTGIYSKERQTELPRAYVVLKEGEKEDKAAAAEIAAWLQERVASHKRLRGGVVFRKEIPKSVSGKILRRVLRDQAKLEEEGLKAKL